MTASGRTSPPSDRHGYRGWGSRCSPRLTSSRFDTEVACPEVVSCPESSRSAAGSCRRIHARSGLPIVSPLRRQSGCRTPRGARRALHLALSSA